MGLDSTLKTNSFPSLIRTHPDQLNTAIWNPSSTFLLILNRLDAIYHNLPSRYRLEDLHASDMTCPTSLGGLFFLHFLIHAVAFDLTRISLPGFNFPLAITFQSAAPGFLSQCQHQCRFHALRATSLVRQGLSYGRVPFDDIFTADAALEAAKIQIIYASTVDQSTEIIQETRFNIDITLKFFQTYNLGRNGASQYVRHYSSFSHSPPC